MSYTAKHEHIEKETVSYVLNSGFSDKAVGKMLGLQQKIKHKFRDIVWLLPQDALHITLMDWLAPFVDYPKNPDKLFSELSANYKNTLEGILKKHKPIKVRFKFIKVSPNTIYIQGEDDGSYNEIRQKFLKKIDLLPGTKQPPDIIHASLARFTGKHSMEKVEEFLKELTVDFTETVKELRLVRETKLPMLEYDVVERYSLE